MLLKGNHSSFSWLVILTLSCLEIIMFMTILHPEKNKIEEDTCDRSDTRTFVLSGGLSNSAEPLVSKSRGASKFSIK